MQDWQSKIDEIMDHFDFGVVAKTMLALNWKWAAPGGENEIPPEAEIRAMARAQLWSAVKSDDETTTIGSGGFESTKSGGELTLRFIVCSYSTDPDGVI